MARVCIYNSMATADTAGGVVDHALVSSSGSPKRSVPFRLFGGGGEVRYVSLEFIWQNNAVTALDLRWWMEYWGDAPSLASPPSLRVANGIGVSTPWARERTEEVGAVGAITHNLITRTLSLAAGGSAAWLPLAVHALWARVACYVNGAVPTPGQLIIAAHLGGHTEEKYLEDHGDVPYVYDAA